MALVAQLGDDIVAVARYDRTGGDEAEVAFTVQDDQQGRGLGHAAARAPRGGRALEGHHDVHRRHAAQQHADAERVRRRGLGRATPLRRRHRARAVLDRTDDGLDRGDRSRASSTPRRASTARLLAPRSIAVIGASRRAGTIGHELFRNLLAYDFQGPVYPVNPTSASVAGVRAYPSVLDVPDAVDLAVVVVPAAAVPDVVERLRAERRARRS